MKSKKKKGKNTGVVKLFKKLVKTAPEPKRVKKVRAQRATTLIRYGEDPRQMFMIPADRASVEQMVAQASCALQGLSVYEASETQARAVLKSIGIK